MFAGKVKKVAAPRSRNWLTLSTIIREVRANERRRIRLIERSMKRIPKLERKLAACSPKK